MSRGFQAVSVRREGKVYETRFTEAQGIQGLDGLVGIAALVGIRASQITAEDFDFDFVLGDRFDSGAIGNDLYG